MPNRKKMSGVRVRVMRKLSDLPLSQTRTALEHLRHGSICGPPPQQRDAKEETVWVGERENRVGKGPRGSPAGERDRSGGARAHFRRDRVEERAGKNYELEKKYDRQPGST